MFALFPRKSTDFHLLDKKDKNISFLAINYILFDFYSCLETEIQDILLLPMKVRMILVNYNSLNDISQTFVKQHWKSILKILAFMKELCKKEADSFRRQNK